MSNCFGPTLCDRMQAPSPPATQQDGRISNTTYPPSMSSSRPNASHSSSRPPRLFSLERVTTLLVSLLVALCSGTNYVCSQSSILHPQVTEHPILLSRFTPVRSIPLHEMSQRPNTVPSLWPSVRCSIGTISHTTEPRWTRWQQSVVSLLLLIITLSLTFRSILQSSVGTYGTGPLHGKLVDARGPRPSLVIAGLFLLIGYMGIKAIFDAGLKQGQEQASTATVVLLVFCGFLTGTGGSGASSGSLNTVAKSFPERIVSVRILFHNSRSFTYPSIVTCREPPLPR